MTKANVFIVGFMKSGTTALAHFLSEHPEVCVSIPKEPAYFATDLMHESDEFHGSNNYFRVRTNSDYQELFSHQKDSQKALVDASTAYIYSKDAAKNIHRYNPNSKIIIMVRNPVDFLHSLHMQYINEAAEPELDFEKAMSLESQRRQGKKVPNNVRVPSYLYYSERADYYQQIKRYYDEFDSSQIMIVPTEEFQADNPGVYKKVLRFIGVDPSFEPEFKTVLGSKKPRSVVINSIAHNPSIKRFWYRILGNENYTNLVKKSKRILLKNEQRQKLDSSIRLQLSNKYSSMGKKTSKLVGIDLLDIWKIK